MDANGGAREGDVLSRPSSHAAALVLPSPRSREVRLPGHASHPRFPRPGRRPVPSRAGNAPRESSAPGLDPDGQCLAHRLVEAEVSAAGLIGAAPGLRRGGRRAVYNTAETERGGKWMAQLSMQRMLP